MSEAAQPKSGSVIPFAVVTLIWGSTWLVIRHQLGVVPPSWSVTYRFVVAAVTMFLYALATRTPLRLPRSMVIMAVLIGLAQFVLNFNFVYRAEAYVTSGLVAVVFALLVVPNAILARVFLGQHVSRPFLLGSAVALAGIGMLFAHELRLDGADPYAVFRGVGFTLLGVLSASCANIMQATERVRAAPVATLVAWGMAAAAGMNAALALAMSGPPVFDTSPAYLAGVLYLGIVASAVAFVLYYRVIRDIGAARAAYSSVLIPILAMGMSTAFEGYRWSLAAAAGAALTFAGLLVALSARKPSR